MSEKQKKQYPYQTLGTWLKQMRQKSQQSVAEVSGAVEIDTDTLSDIERGAKRPSEDILMLLISYFSVKEDEAVKAWEMAGYGKPSSIKSSDNDSHEDALQPVIVMPMDARIVYTDMANVQINKYGLTINFLQSDGIGSKPLAVSRVGMSREHAEKLIITLEKALRPPEQKLLSEPDSGSEESKNS